MELKETADMMCSADYKERFKAEYYQLKIRMTKLCNMIGKWLLGELSFTPTCPMEIYSAQVRAMAKYLKILEERARLENVEL